jgi:selenium metabolism protein YedF
MIKLDYSQHKCPYPVVETRKQILAHPGNTFIVLVSDKAGCDNVARLAGKMGYDSSNLSAREGFCLTLTPFDGSAAEEVFQPEKTKVDIPNTNEKTVIYCGSDRMGSGDDEFGRVLMRNFVTTLLEMDPLPTTILFVNSGISLTTDGSDVIEALQKLHKRGVDLASCGLCLEYYEKKDQLKVGRVTNMYEMAELQCNATRVITP